MTADVHHLGDVVFVAEVHVGDSGVSGGVCCDAVVARHHNLSFGVTLYGQFARCLIVLLFHCRARRLFVLCGDAAAARQL